MFCKKEYQRWKVIKRKYPSPTDIPIEQYDEVIDEIDNISDKIPWEIDCPEWWDDMMEYEAKLYDLELLRDEK